MKNVLNRLEAIGRGAENIALVTLLSSMMLLAVAQIVMREFFGTGFIWADGLIRLMVLWLAMVGSIAAARENRHIRIDAVSHVMPDAVVKTARVIVDLFAAAVCAVLAWHAWRYLQLEMEFEDTVLINTPSWIVHSIVPAAFLLVSYRFVVGVAQQLFEYFHPADQESAV